MLIAASILLFTTFGISNVEANTAPAYGKMFPPAETFTPGDWFLGETPLNYDENRPPIVFVQGRNGSADSWYGETVYHSMNDMYDYAYRAGYQAVFVQLYDAAGKGSASQWDNGKLLAAKLEEIYNHFGKKVNIVAHSKGGIDTQAALIQYGANRFVGKAITLASPHYGSNLADLSYSWWAGWLASLLGQRDNGTYSLQTGEMAQFRSIIDNNPNAKLNRYYTVAGTSWGPAFSALSLGGLYLSAYGSNDGLVNEWSAKLPYGTHLFTDSRFDHDNIRKGSAVFSRIEPYLRTSVVTSVPFTSNNSSQETTDGKNITSNQNVLGGELIQNNWVDQTFAVDTKTEGVVSVLTASSEVQIQLISPSGKVYTNKDSKETVGNEDSYFKGASIRIFKIDQMEIGQWHVKILTTGQKDAYMIITDYKQDAPFTLKMPGKIKAEKAEFQLKQSTKSSINQDNLSVTVRVVDREGKLVSQSSQLRKLDAITFTGFLNNITQSGVYNVTIDMKGPNTEGKAYTRTIVRSVYIEK
ncbi:hypothetical protein QUF88_19005 [Bacillus sp. DX1.1]|uniref:lipase family alpha/beta hydrolase n=1 Tax=unclassified Bacillus (in: firmicutes) TaxID=185979 RepID=UPI002570C44A|nr:MULTISPECIES: hypothetical protein [unclassified Bacillus (in: firmicutes)]MDM5155802.1 hypothetical protein [Bacillus sp. DX1.1]WJE84118.1 hypothetical protein QRE67_16535 [Bacillus sp. DX3.1]